MKVLFVSSGNRLGSVNPLIKVQGNSLNEVGMHVEHFLITKKGMKGYLTHISDLKKVLSKKKYDIIHAHFSYSGFTAALAGAKPLVVSLMGSDVNSNYLQKFLIYPFHKFFWNKTIVKSEKMYEKLGFKQVKIIPNGIDTEKFNPHPKHLSLQKLKWNDSHIHILFAANPQRHEKNFALAKESISRFENKYDVKVNIHLLNGIPHDLVPYYMSACNVILLTSKWEGSPNVIKEAMSCNRPIVSTNVGDVEWLLNGVYGSYIADHDAEDISDKINLAYQYSLSHFTTNGRSKIFQLNLRSISISQQISNLYKTLVESEHSN